MGFLFAVLWASYWKTRIVLCPKRTAEMGLRCNVLAFQGRNVKERGLLASVRFVPCPAIFDVLYGFFCVHQPKHVVHVFLLERYLVEEEKTF